MRSHHAKIRAFLREYPDGATPQVISDCTGLRADSVRQSLGSMPDVYIDRWMAAGRGQWAAVWCVVDVPAHCPHPKDEVANAA